MPKFTAWIKFCIEVEAADEDGARDVAIEKVSEVIEVRGQIDVPYVEEEPVDD